jgi:hypothetical protein
LNKFIKINEISGFHLGMIELIEEFSAGQLDHMTAVAQ